MVQGLVMLLYAMKARVATYALEIGDKVRDKFFVHPERLPRISLLAVLHGVQGTAESASQWRLKEEV